MRIKNTIDTFHKRYNVDVNDCWIWNSAKQPTKSPNWWFNGKEQLVHRWSYQYFKGPIPQGLVVCHSCDNPHCVNPNHLFIGTQKDNIQDCIKKGRRFKKKIGSEDPTLMLPGQVDSLTPMENQHGS
jgi:hypothetical protein